MPRFLYQVRNSQGEPDNGVVNAASIEEASLMLRGEGKYIIRIAPAGEATDPDAPISLQVRARRVKRDQVINFAHQLAVMVDTGVPLVEALESISVQCDSPDFKAILDDVTLGVQAGTEFSAALRKYPKVFPPIMVSLIRASEMSGTMGVMLDRISGYLAKERTMVKKVRGALAYPVFMVVFALSVTVFLLIYVLPKFADIYSSRGAALPVPTRILLNTSNFVIHNGILLAVAAGAALIAAFFTARTPAGRRAIDYLKLNTPILGSLFRKLYITRGCRTMGTMISAGVSMLDMVSIVRQVTNNVFYDDLWEEVDERLRQGSQLSDPLFASSLIPRSIAQMIFSGEKSGRLGQVMDKIAHYTEQDFDEAVKTTTQFIEPLMVGVMGGIIGFVAISLLLPIFSVGRVMAGN
jgi:type IV pilus assembly protein PilC